MVQVRYRDPGLRGDGGARRPRHRRIPVLLRGSAWIPLRFSQAFRGSPLMVSCCVRPGPSPPRQSGVMGRARARRRVAAVPDAWCCLGPSRAPHLPGGAAQGAQRRSRAAAAAEARAWRGEPDGAMRYAMTAAAIAQRQPILKRPIGDETLRGWRHNL